MSTALALAALTLLSPLLLAQNHYVESDSKTDFATLKTFMVREGQVTSQRPEFRNKHALNEIQSAIRADLLAKGLKEISDRPDLIVTFRVTERPKGGGLSFGSLVIEMTRRTADSPVWRGYSEDSRTIEELMKRLPDEARKLLSEYPPKDTKKPL
jgi:hypothetical protein